MDLHWWPLAKYQIERQWELRCGEAVHEYTLETKQGVQKGGVHENTQLMYTGYTRFLHLHGISVMLGNKRKEKQKKLY